MLAQLEYPYSFQIFPEHLLFLATLPSQISMDQKDEQKELLQLVRKYHASDSDFKRYLASLPCQNPGCKYSPTALLKDSLLPICDKCKIQFASRIRPLNQLTQRIRPPRQTAQTLRPIFQALDELSSAILALKQKLALQYKAAISAQSKQKSILVEHMLRLRDKVILQKGHSNFQMLWDWHWHFRKQQQSQTAGKVTQAVRTIVPKIKLIQEQLKALKLEIISRCTCPCQLRLSQTALEIASIQPTNYETVYDLAISSKDDLMFHQNELPPALQHNLGICFMKIGRLEKAQYLLKQAAKTQSLEASALYNLGLLAKERGSCQAAIQYFTDALQIDKDNFNALNNLGCLYRQIRRLRKAQKYLNKAVVLGEGQPTAFYNLALVLRDQGKNQLAIKNFKKAVELSAGFEAARVQLKEIQQKR